MRKTYLVLISLSVTVSAQAQSNDSIPLTDLAEEAMGFLRRMSFTFWKV